MIEIDLSEFIHDDMDMEDLRLHLREAVRMKWIHLPAAVPLIQNFNNTKKILPVSGARQEIKECPQARLGKKVTKETCTRCPCCVGLNDDYVECFYDFRLSNAWGKYPYPGLQPIKQEFDQVLIPVRYTTNTPLFFAPAIPRRGIILLSKETFISKKEDL